MKNLKSLFSILSLCLLILAPLAMQAQSKATQYSVIINHEEQYSLWLKNQKPPKGWKVTKFSGSQQACQQHIRRVWTDMRPLSIRKDYPKHIKYGVVYEIETKFAPVIWPMSKPLPPGYKATAYKGSFEGCTKHIEEVWTDMRPRSLQKQ